MSVEERRKWDARHAGRGFFPPLPATLITECERFLPQPGGKALDVAGGTGRHALWLADCGHRSTLLDISPVALELALVEAGKRGVSLETVCADLESDPFPQGPWDVILSYHYLHRPLFNCFAHELSGDGILLFVQPTLRNLERHPRPGARFLLEEGELSNLAAQSGLQVIKCDEEWSSEGRHEALLVARRGDSS